MNILLNGEECQCAPQLTLLALLERFGYANRTVAIEVNRNIIPKSQHATTILQAGDRIEIVHAIGGG